MSGQPAFAFEMSSIESAEFTQEPLEREQSDPIASFLEKHGSSLVQNHEGQMVTVAEAMASCPPFYRLVETMGEAAMSLMAPKQEQEDENEEAEETEQEKTEQESETVKIAKKSEPEVAKNEQTQTRSRDEEGKVDSNQIADSLEIAKVINIAIESNQAEPLHSVKVELRGSKEKNYENSALTAVLQESVTAGVSQKTNETFSPTNVQVIETEESVSTLNDGIELTLKKVEKSAQETSIGQAPTDTNDEIVEAKADFLPKYEEFTNLLAGTGAADTENYSEDNKFDIAQPTEVNLTKDDLLVVDWTLSKSFKIDEVPKIDAYEDFILLNEGAFAFTFIEHGPDWSEIAPELKQPIEEVEKTVTLVAQRIEDLDDEQAKDVHEILDQIVQKVEHANYLTESNFEVPEKDLKTEDQEDEIKDLFIQLFDLLDVEYTPELIETIVSLTLRGGLAKFIAKEKKETEASKDKGTHEAINKLLIGIGKIKKAILYACHLGKSAIHLYSNLVPV